MALITHFGHFPRWLLLGWTQAHGGDDPGNGACHHVQECGERSGKYCHNPFLSGGALCDTAAPTFRLPHRA